jgi:hypothetical protein
MNFVQRFVPNFVVMVKPIHNILKIDKHFSWNEDVEKSFCRNPKNNNLYTGPCETGFS